MNKLLALAIMLSSVAAYAQENVASCPPGKPYCIAKPVVSAKEGARIDSETDNIKYDKAVEAEKAARFAIRNTDRQSLCKPPYKMSPDGCQGPLYTAVSLCQRPYKMTPNGCRADDLAAW